MQLIKYYFLLQYRLLSREIEATGFHPTAGYLCGTILYLFLSAYLFSKYPQAGYLYAIAGIALAQSLGEYQRNVFLKTIFSKQKYLLIRIIENLLATLPFIVFLIYKQHFIPCILLVATNSLLVFIPISVQTSLVLPTPFYKKPFEFIIGFRNTVIFLLLAYLLTYMSISSGNFNLGAFSVLLIFLICVSYFTTPEPPYYVWIHCQKAKDFLYTKMKTGTLLSSALTLPATIALCIFYPANYLSIVAVQLLGGLLLLLVIIVKYAAFPGKISLPEGFAIALSASFPPLFLVTVPFFYKKSIRNLTELLG